jgi:hypothetical protein
MNRAFRHIRLTLLLLMVTAVCLPLLLFKGETNYTADESAFYMPAVRQITAHWPQLDLQRDSLSATPPGYPYFLASLGKIIGGDRTSLRFVNLFVSLGVLVVLWMAWPSGVSPGLQLAAILPLAGSNFFIKSASYVVTDNASLLIVAATLCLTLVAGNPSALPVAGAAAALGVFLRQINFWLEAPLLLRLFRTRAPLHWWPALLPFALLLWLVQAWGGLVPPAWASVLHRGVFPAAGAYQLAVFGCLGGCYYLAGRPDWRNDLSSRWVALGGVLGLTAALVGPTTPDVAAGRWGGYLWELSARLPQIGTASSLFLLLSPVGGVILALLTRRLWTVIGAERALIWLATVLAFMATGLVNRQIFHRYYEPTFLVLLFVWLILVQKSPTERSSRPRPQALYALGLLQIVVTLLTAHARTFGLF